MKVIEADDLYDGWLRTCEYALWCPPADYAVKTSMWSAIYDVVLMTPTMRFEKFDVGNDLWFTRARWTKLQRDYLDPPEVPLFLQRCQAIYDKYEKGGAVAQMLCRHSRHANGKEQHAWGNCMMGITYRGGPRFTQPTFTLHSRASYIAYLGGLDIALVWAIAREFADRVGMDLDDIAFRWHIDSLQWHAFKSIPFVTANGWQDTVLEARKVDHNAYITATMLRRFEGPYATLELEEIKYSVLRRIVDYYRRVVWDDNPLPSVPVHTLRLLPEMLGGEG